MPPSDRQLDLFADSTAVVRRNDVLAALQGRDAAAARAALQALAEVEPANPFLPALSLLADALDDDAPIATVADLAHRRATLGGPLRGAAREAFGAAESQAWLAPGWRSLAIRSAGVAYAAAQPDEHAAACWLEAGDWPSAAEATARIASWRRLPTPLAWMAEARCRHDGLDATWPLLAELAWLAPRRLDALVGRLGDPLLSRLHRQFGADFEGAGDAGDLAWFPAWLLIAAPALAPQLACADAGEHTPPEQAMRLLLDLLALEREGRHHDLVARRKSLRQLDESIYAGYMATRQERGRQGS